MEKESRINNKIIQKAAMGMAAGIALFGQGLPGSPMEQSSTNPTWNT